MLKKAFHWIKKYRYLLLLVMAIVYMTFFDDNSFINQARLSKELRDLRKQETFYRQEIIQDSLAIEALNDPDGLEKYAREHFYMKKADEDIFIIVEE